MKVELSINGENRTADVEPRKTLLDCLREDFGLTGTHAGCEHGVCGACTVLLDGEPVRSCLMFAVQADGYEITTIEGIAPAPGELSVIQDAFCEMHGLQCGYCTPGMMLTAHALLRDNPQPTREEIVEAISGNICRCTGYGQIVEAIALAAERLRARQCAAGASNDDEHRAPPIPLRLHQSPCARGSPLRRRHGPIRRRCRGRRTCCMWRWCRRRIPPRASFRSTPRRRLALPGVHYVLTGDELAAATDPLMNGLDTPKVRRYPLAVEQARYVGEWVAAVVAETRALAEDARRAGRGRLRAAAFRDRSGSGAAAGRAAGASARTAPTCCSTAPSSGARSNAISPQAPQHLSFRVRLGPQLDGADRDLRRRGAPGIRGANCSTSGRRSRCRNMPIRSRARCGSRPTRCACIRTSMSAAATASSAASSTPCSCALSGAPARPAGAADRGPAGEHARRRRARAGPDLRRRGRLQRRRHRPLDEDARARQCRRLCRPRAVPARQADRRHRRSLQDSKRRNTARSR